MVSAEPSRSFKAIPESVRLALDAAFSVSHNSRLWRSTLERLPRYSLSLKLVLMGTNTFQKECHITTILTMRFGLFFLFFFNQNGQQNHCARTSCMSLPVTPARPSNHKPRKHCID